MELRRRFCFSRPPRQYSRTFRARELNAADDWLSFSRSLVPQPASNDLDQKGVTVGLSDRYQFDSGAIFTTIAQYTRFDSNAHGQGLADMLVTPEGWGGYSAGCTMYGQP
jgi:hypothetical protein